MTVEVWAEKILRGGVFVCSTSLSARHNQSARARPRALPAGLGVQLHEPLCIMPEQSSAKSPLWLKRLGSRIRQARRIRGFTQTDIAKPNLTKSFISLLESGRTYPSVSTLVTLASRLQTSLALLLLEAPQLPRETVLNMLELARASAPSNVATARARRRRAAWVEHLPGEKKLREAVRMDRPDRHQVATQVVDDPAVV